MGKTGVGKVNFGSHVQSMAIMIEATGIQFADNNSRLYRIDTKQVFGVTMSNE